MAALLAVTVLAGCHAVVRLDPAQVRLGDALFAQHCARCHGLRGVGQDPRHPAGSADRKVGFVAPALNGTGHAFLHGPAELFGMIRDGTGLPGSPMPAFASQLSDAQMRALIAYVYSLWPPEMRSAYEASNRAAMRALLNAPR